MNRLPYTVPTRRRVLQLATSNETTVVSVTVTLTHRQRVADSLARDCRWSSAEAMRRSLRRVLGPYYADEGGTR